MNKTLLHSATDVGTTTGLLKTRTATTSRPKPALIIDTHQHLWDLSTQTLPWLARMPMVLKQSFGPQEYCTAMQGLNVKAVYMEVDVMRGEEAAEATKIINLASSVESPTIGAVIGGRIGSPEFHAYFFRFAHYPVIKGIRHVLHLEEPGYCLQETFVRDVNLIGELGKTFDLCMRPTDLDDGVKLATLCPKTHFILDHCGCPDLKIFRTLRAGEDKPSHTANQWKRSIEAFAKCPNVSIKISGVIESLPRGGDASDLAPPVNHCLDCFGPDRVVFGSNWPVCLLGGSPKQWIEFLLQIVGEAPETNQRKLWTENAIKIYSIQI